MPNVFAYRLAPSGKDRVLELLRDNQIAIGWSNLDEEVAFGPFTSKERIRAQILDYYPQLAASVTKGTNQIWRFGHELAIGDIVAVPHHGTAHFVRVASAPIYLSDKVHDDTAFRRNIEKLTSIEIKELPEPIKQALYFRGHASVALHDIKDHVFDYLGLDPAVLAEEDEAIRAEKLLRESMGSYIIPPKGETIVSRKHAAISNALIEHLEGKGYMVINTRTAGLAPDLYTHCEANPLLFEIKTGSGSGDYLKGLGQLLFYEKLRGRSYRKYLVAPKGIGETAAIILNDYSVRIIEVSEIEGRYQFDWPSSGTD